MAFIRKFFRGDNPAEPKPDPAQPTPAPDQPAPAVGQTPAPPAATAPLADPAVQPAPAEPSPTDAWWASSAAESDAPPTSQSATVSHITTLAEPVAEAAPTPAAPAAAATTPDTGSAAAAPGAVAPEAPAAPAAADDETAPHSLVEIEQTRVRLEAEQAAATTPPGGTPAAEPLEGTRSLDEDSAPAISARRSAQGLAAAALRDIGRVRELNQDSVFALLTTLPRESSDLSVGLFIVADGMGGHHGGEVASRLAVRSVVYQVLSQLVLPALDDTQEMALQALMVAAVQAANEAIWDYAQGAGSDMGTTCTAVLMVGQGLYIAHVGDSRAYLYEPGGLKLLTSDHSTVGRLIQLGQLEASEAREHPLRNQLYRTVGQQPQIPVDFVYQPLGAGSHLLLASDGLWGLVEEALMEQALNRSPWPQDACHELIALANLAGGEDNISAVVVALPIAER